MPRLLWPSWRWMTISGTPSRAISTARACRSWCGRSGAALPPRRRCAAARRGRGRRPVASARRAVEDAQQWTDRKRAPQLAPGLQFFPAPGVHADLATAPALAAPNQQPAASVIEVSLGEREGFLDA